MKIYPLEKFEDHADCPNKGLDTSSPHGWWCTLHNVDLTAPVDDEE